jgi:preprotein translocase subunit SecA
VYAAAEDPVAETGALATALLAEQGTQVAPQMNVLAGPATGNGNAGGNGGKAQVKRPNAPDPDALVPIVKQQHEKVGRNEPCWCGSGKKYKFCHGAA